MVNKERLHFPTHGEVKRLFSTKEKMITQHNYTDAEVNEMVRRKQAVGLSTVSLGVQRVRLERDLRAAQDMQNFEKAIILEDRLQKLLAKNEELRTRRSMSISTSVGEKKAAWPLPIVVLSLNSSLHELQTLCVSHFRCSIPAAGLQLEVRRAGHSRQPSKNAH